MRRLLALTFALTTSFGIFGACPAFADTAAPSVANGQTTSVVGYDTFNRTTTSGLGTADVGDAWSTNLGGNASSVNSIAPGYASFTNIKPGRSTEAYLVGSSALDIAISGAFSVPSMTSSTKVYQAYEARRQTDGSAYLAKTTWGANGQLSISFSRRQGAYETLLSGTTIPVSIAVAQKITVNFNVVGTSPVVLTARAYRAGSIVPAWQLTQTDSSASRIARAGGVGLWDYVPRSSPSVTVKQNAFGAWALSTRGSAPTAGALPIGTASYPMPTGSLFVDPVNGSDNGTGAPSSPYRTIAAAVVAVPPGGTVVMRGGTYRQQLLTGKSNFTLQSNPGEAVWLDGTSHVTGFTTNGLQWVAPWAYKFDHSSSFSRGDSTLAGGGPVNFGFVNTNYPMAAWPDQVFVDGQQLQQVASNPDADQFAVNYSAATLTLGSNPAGHIVTADTLDAAITVSGANVNLRGFGVRGYATSLAGIGTVAMYGSGDTIENVEIDNAPTQALSMDAPNQNANRVTVLNAGMTGIHSNTANGLVVENVKVTGSNIEHFNAAPASAGIKITRATNVTVQNSVVSSNFNSNGIWLDENVVGFKIVGNTVANTGPTSDGVIVELSGSGLVASNAVTGNKYGIMLLDSGNSRIYNNSLAGSSFGSVVLLQDNRYQPGKGSAGASVQPSASNPWLVQNVEVVNNLFAANGGQYGFQFYAKDDQTNRPASSMNITLTGNLFHTKNASTSTDRMVAWGGSDNYSWTEYPTPAALTTALRTTWTNAQVAGLPDLTAMGDASNATVNAAPLPIDIATALGQPAGIRHIGSF